MTSLQLLRTEANQKLAALLKQLDNIRSSEFPYQHGRDALAVLKDYLGEHQEKLAKNLPGNADASVIKAECGRINILIWQYLPLLGFILRSTNVRNAFELFDPLLRLSQQLLSDDAKLVLSSEWDYSPMTYPMTVQALPNFVFIGLPASESENALIIPLAGHELGHSVWQQQQMENHFIAETMQRLKEAFGENWDRFTKTFNLPFEKEKLEEGDLEVLAFLSQSMKFTMRQIQEIFCDLLGLKIFGIGFLHAFRYLLGPGQFGRRSSLYPTLRIRALFLVKAAPQFAVSCPPDFVDNFDVEKHSDNEKERFLVDMADIAADRIFGSLIEKCNRLASEAKITLPDDTVATGIAKRFSLGIPADGIHSLSDIVNAAWYSLLGSELPAKKSRNPGHSVQTLNEMVLKSIEVSEFSLRTQP